MIDGHALRVGATRLDRTRVTTHLSNAGFGEIAVTIASASVDASAILAYLRGSALVVRNATGNDGAFAYLAHVAHRAVVVFATSGQFQALGLRIAGEVGRTGASGSVVEGYALGIDAARTPEGTRVVTLLRVAGHVQSAVLVTSTAGEALAFDADVSDRAVFVGAALESSDALPVNTELVERTVGIGFARYRFLKRKRASDGWVAFEGRSARADWLVTSRLTNCILAANSTEQTGVRALKTNAALVIGTATVRSATSDTLIALANLGRVGPAVHINHTIHASTRDLWVSRESGRT